MSITRGIIIILLLQCLFSCEKETELAIPEPTSKLVVNSILEANQKLKVYVGKSNYTLDNSAKYTTNASVIATLNNGSKIDTLHHTDSGFYVSDKLICIPDSTYTISISNTEFEDATAKVTVPSTVRFNNYSFNQNAGTNKSGFQNMLITVNIPDIEEKINYYMLFFECHSLGSTSVSPEGFISNTTWYSFSPIIMAEGSEEEIAFSDELFNGEIAEIPMNFHMWNYADFYDLTYSLKCYLVTISSEYYKYHKSYNLVMEAENDIWLANSPPQLFSNIENAFGICAAINISDSICIEFK